jgi:hypothetical protein
MVAESENSWLLQLTKERKSWKTQVEKARTSVAQKCGTATTYSVGAANDGTVSGLIEGREETSVNTEV